MCVASTLIGSRLRLRIKKNLASGFGVKSNRCRRTRTSIAMSPAKASSLQFSWCWGRECREVVRAAFPASCCPWNRKAFWRDHCPLFFGLLFKKANSASVSPAYSSQNACTQHKKEGGYEFSKSNCNSFISFLVKVFLYNNPRLSSNWRILLANSLTRWDCSICHHVRLCWILSVVFYILFPWLFVSYTMWLSDVAIGNSRKENLYSARYQLWKEGNLGTCLRQHTYDQDQSSTSTALCPMLEHWQ